MKAVHAENFPGTKVQQELHSLTNYTKCVHLQVLLAAGADTTQIAEDGDSALHLACQINDDALKSQVLTALLEHGAKTIINRHGFKVTLQLCVSRMC